MCGKTVRTAPVGRPYRRFSHGWGWDPWFKGKKSVIGVGMIPRGEVGLIFAQMGLTAGVFDAAMFGAVTLMVMVTTFIAPPVLKVLFPRCDRSGPSTNPKAFKSSPRRRDRTRDETRRTESHRRRNRRAPASLGRTRGARHRAARTSRTARGDADGN